MFHTQRSVWKVTHQTDSQQVWMQRLKGAGIVKPLHQLLLRTPVLSWKQSFITKATQSKLTPFHSSSATCHSQVSAFASGYWGMRDEMTTTWRRWPHNQTLLMHNAAMALSISKSHLPGWLKWRCVCPDENNLCHSYVTVPGSCTQLQNPHWTESPWRRSLV